MLWIDLDQAWLIDRHVELIDTSRLIQSDDELIAKYRQMSAESDEE